MAKFNEGCSTMTFITQAERRADSQIPPKARLITDRIQNLFADRRIGDHLRMVKAGPGRGHFLRDLSSLQAAIYDLDVYGESSWAVSEAQLNTLWTHVRIAYYSLNADLSIESAFAEIQRYQAIEMEMRELVFPCSMNIGEFYRLKTCDVRLSRDLLNRRFPEINSASFYRSWDLYDIISEVCDDLADVNEDALTYNGNRFLISFLLHGAAETCAEYQDFLRDLGGVLEHNARAACNPDKENEREVIQWSANRLGWAFTNLPHQIRNLQALEPLWAHGIPLLA